MNEVTTLDIFPLLIEKPGNSFRCSSSERWSRCPGSVSAEKQYPNESSPAAEEGTRAHAVAETALFLGGNEIPTKDEQGEIPQEMRDAVGEYLNYIYALMDDKSEMLLERYFDLGKSGILPGVTGTTDCVIIKDEECHVIDFKYGRGVKVYAEENRQLILYAMGLHKEIADGDIKLPARHPLKYHLHIVQPRARNFSTWTMGRLDVPLWMEIFNKAIENATRDNAPRIAGDIQCKWCSHKSSCDEYYNHGISVFDDISKGNATDEQRRYVLDNSANVKKLITETEEYVCDRLQSGGTFQGYKLGTGRKTTKWNKVANENFKGNDDMWRTQLITVTEAKKLLNAAALKENTEVSYGKRPLVKVVEDEPQQDNSVNLKR